MLEYFGGALKKEAQAKCLRQGCAGILGTP
jgi:hypothetical protein